MGDAERNTGNVLCFQIILLVDIELLASGVDTHFWQPAIMP